MLLSSWWIQCERWQVCQGAIADERVVANSSSLIFSWIHHVLNAVGDDFVTVFTDGVPVGFSVACDHHSGENTFRAWRAVVRSSPSREGVGLKIRQTGEHDAVFVGRAIVEDCEHVCICGVRRGQRVPRNWLHFLQLMIDVRLFPVFSDGSAYASVTQEWEIQLLRSVFCNESLLVCHVGEL